MTKDIIGVEVPYDLLLLQFLIKKIMLKKEILKFKNKILKIVKT